MDKGVFQIKGNQLTPYVVDGYFNRKEIRFIISLGPNSRLIGTSNDGILKYDGQKMEVWNTSQHDYFRKNIINPGCLTSDGQIIIGTKR